MPASRIEIKNIHHEYQEPNSEKSVVALSDVTLDVRGGEFLAILGPSGSGKSTLLHLIAGLLHPTAGEISVDSRVVSGPGPDRAIAFQDYALFPWKTVQGNIEFGPKIRGLPKAERTAIAEELIRLTGLMGFEDRFPHHLSGGMKQRVGVARALANSPGVLLMDEPFAAVDALTRLVLQEELSRIWWERRPTVVLVTHSVEEAVFLADRVVVMSARPGRIAAILDVPLDRPRRWAILKEDDTFRKLTARALDEVMPSL